MVRSGLFILIFLLAGLQAQSQNSHKTRLNTGWEFLKSDLGGIWEAVRPAEKGRPESVPVWEQVHLPHSFNAYDAVDPDMNYYQGPGWYRTRLEISNPYPQGRTMLHFEGTGQKTAVYVYMTKVGSHVGGYDEWSVDITEAVEAFKKTDVFKTQFKGKIPIAIRCDNSRDLQLIPSDLSDFNLYGGIYRYLNLVYVPALSIDKIFATASVDAKGRSGKLNVRARFHDPAGATAADVEARLLDPEGTVVDRFSGHITSFSRDENIWNTEIRKPSLWSPSSPVLYTVEVRLKTPQGTHIQTEKIGFRNFEFIRKGPFHLNGERLLLRGTHRHEDHSGVANAMTEDQIRTEMVMMKEMGVNFIRLGHYQQSRIVLNLCDSLGILVWEEIPWCRGGLGGEIYKEQARRMLINMIEQHYNHPSVIIWGLGNENDWPGDFPMFDKEKIRQFMTELNDIAHRLDPSRKTAIRRCDFCKDIVDVYSPSIWAGWYRGIYTEYRKVSEEEFKEVDHFLHVEWGGDSHARRHSENPDKALAGISAGGGADERAGDASLFGGAARVSKNGDWSESYIVNLIDWHLKEQETMPWLTGTAYWPFKDFSTPVRPDNPVPYMNQKGVVERDFNKKESYYVFQSYWTEKPMVHIYGHSWPVRWGDAGDKKMIKVYSNCNEAELFVNGISQGMKKRNSQDFPAAGLRWMVLLNEGKNNVHVIARKGNKEVRDEITFEYQTEQWEGPAKMVLEKLTEKNDTATVQVRLLDKNGVPCLDAANWIRFSLAGDGELIDNQGTSTGSRKVQLYNGRALISLKANGGKNGISVQSEGIPTVLLTLGSESADSGKTLSGASINASSLAALQKAINKADAGDRIILADGVYNSSSLITIARQGTALKPITISAESIGGVTIAGSSGFSIDSSARYIIIKGFIFKHAADSSCIVEFGAAHCRFTQNVFELAGRGSYLIVRGHDTEIDYNTFQNKSTEGRMILVEGPGGEPVVRHVWIHHNYFNNFRNSGFNNSSAIQFGRSWSSLTPAYGLVEYNLFVNCRGENENIAHKASNCVYRYNTFGPGSSELSLRHGNHTEVYGNFFLNTEGIRIFGDDHRIYSNYFEGNSRAIHLGNGRAEVADGADLKTHDRPDRCEIVYNTLVNNAQNFYMGSREEGLGATHTTIANNIIQGGGPAAEIHGPNTNAVWEGNIVWNTSGTGDLPSAGYQFADPLLSKSDSATYHIQAGSPAIDAGAGSYSYVKSDIDGKVRGKDPDPGADEYLPSPILNQPLTIADVGADASPGDPSSGVREPVKKQVQERVLKEAAWAMEQQPVTVTASVSERSAGGKHDFYSEGDYWWPDPENPDGPYIRRDGMTNPDNFVAHRHAMIRFSRIIGALSSAYKLTGDEKYVRHALLHLKAWFTDPETLMNPNLLYAQAIKGRVTGRGIGIIDTIHLIEVAQGILAMQHSATFDKKALAGVKSWFDEYIKWLTTHPYGKDEMEAENNHGTCWIMQVASFAKLTGNREVMEFCRERYKNVLLPDQMGADGSFPRELERTKPYGYSLFNLDAMTMICQILSVPGENLWEYETPDGRSIKKGIAFLYPYVADKSAWPFEPDVMYWDNWPVAHPFLVFGAKAYGNRRWLETWKRLDHSPEVEEVIRNLPVRHPLIWLE